MPFQSKIISVARAVVLAAAALSFTASGAAAAVYPGSDRVLNPGSGKVAKILSKRVVGGCFNGSRISYGPAAGTYWVRNAIHIQLHLDTRTRPGTRCTSMLRRIRFRVSATRLQGRRRPVIIQTIVNGRLAFTRVIHVRGTNRVATCANCGWPRTVYPRWRVRPMDRIRRIP